MSDPLENISQLLGALASRGVKLWIDGERLGVRAPSRALTPELRAALRERKDDLLSALRDGLASTEAIPRGSASDSAPSPLSAGQARLWFLSRLVPGSPLYNLHFSVRMKGTLDRAALARALTILVERHDVLRATFPEVDGEPHVVVAPPGPWVPAFIDLRNDDELERHVKLQDISQQVSTAPFDLIDGPLLRTTLVATGGDEHVLLVTQHHILTDGTSVGLFMTELARLYTRQLGHYCAAPASLPIRYTDYARWQASFLRGERAQASLDWWKRNLAPLPRLELPTDRSPARGPTHDGRSYSFEIEAELTAGVKALARRQSCTLFVTLLAVWATLLYRYSRQAQFGIGTFASGRNRPEIAELLGFFVNTLVLPCDLSGDPPATTVLRRLAALVEEAMRHEDVPFERIVGALPRSLSRDLNPLVRASFVLENVLQSAPSVPGMAWEPLLQSLDGGVEGTTKFDIELTVMDVGGRLAATIGYATDLFEDATIERMARHFETLLRGFAERPKERVSQLPIISETERQQLLIEWNRTATGYPKDAGVAELFGKQVARTPDAPAVVFDGESLTYSELEARANRLAHHLRHSGVGHGSLVGLALQRSPEFVVAALATLKASAAYVPFDPSYPRERLRAMFEDAGCDVIVTSRSSSALLPHHPATIVLERDREAISGQPADSPPQEITVGGGDIAYVMYTSGSTGQPKGVCVPHRAIARLVLQTDFIQVRPDDRVAHASNVSFDASTFEIWGALLNGAALVILDSAVMLSPPELVAALRAQRISTLVVTTALFNLVAMSDGSSFASLRNVLFGGEACDPRAVRRVLEAGPPRRLVHGYGPTETTTAATWLLVEEVPPDATTIPIGHPIANTECFALDEMLNLVPVGVVGELYIGGPGLALGYWKRPELTAARFVVHPFDPERRLYRTGDLVKRRADGAFEFVGRVDDQVKLRGFRIELGEIEGALSKVDGVSASVVVAREDTPGDKRLVAYVVPTVEHTITASTLRGALRSVLPEYMVPSAVVFVDALPLTPNGKVDRKALPAPEAERRATGAFVAPRTHTEELIASIWSEVLGVERVSGDDNFFELGGHSLQSVAVAARLARVLGRRVPVALLFQAPTVASLATALESGELALNETVIAFRSSGARVPLFCVHPIQGTVDAFRGLAERLPEDQPVYGLRARGHAEGEKPCEDMNELVLNYLAALRAVQPRGPYRILGYSFGASVAHELACRLAAAGERVDTLILVDGSPSLDAATADIARVVEQAWGEGAWGAPEDRGRIAEVISRMAEVVRAHLVAFAQHVPGRFAGSAVVLRAADRGPDRRADDIGWRPFVQGTLRVVEVPGSHDELFKAPYLDSTAASVLAVLSDGPQPLPDGVSRKGTGTQDTEQLS
jgi:amino acid adenylation domain-containing protein